MCVWCARCVRAACSYMLSPLTRRGGRAAAQQQTRRTGAVDAPRLAGHAHALTEVCAPDTNAAASVPSAPRVPRHHHRHRHKHGHGHRHKHGHGHGHGHTARCGSKRSFSPSSPAPSQTLTTLTREGCVPDTLSHTSGQAIPAGRAATRSRPFGPGPNSGRDPSRPSTGPAYPADSERAGAGHAACLASVPLPCRLVPGQLKAGGCRSGGGRSGPASPGAPARDITLHYITLHYITLHYITLHYII
jgi:hypothetical protein